MLVGMRTIFVSHLPEPEIEPFLVINDIVELEEIFKKSGIQVDALTRWVQAIERKGQAIIYGPARHHVIGTPAKTQLPDPTSGADIRSPWNGIGHY